MAFILDTIVLPIVIDNSTPGHCVQEQPLRKIIHVDMDAFFASWSSATFLNIEESRLLSAVRPNNAASLLPPAMRRVSWHSFCDAVANCDQKVSASHLSATPRFDVYREVSEQIREIFFRYTELVEPLSLDEAYLDVTVNKRELPSATLIAREIKDAIKQETNLTASAGISINKFLAKTASAVDKPNGIYLIPPDKAESFVEQLAIEKFYGIGDVTAEKMRNLGILTGADLKKWSEIDLMQKFGKAGSYYFKIVRGRDDRPVSPNRPFANLLVQKRAMQKISSIETP